MGLSQESTTAIHFGRENILKKTIGKPSLNSHCQSQLPTWLSVVLRASILISLWCALTLISQINPLMVLISLPADQASAVCNSALWLPAKIPPEEDLDLGHIKNNQNEGKLSGDFEVKLIYSLAFI